MLLSLQRYDCEVVYKPGKHLVIADTLSRANLDIEYKDKMDIESQVWLVIQKNDISDARLEELQRETEADETLKLIKQYILEGMA